MQIKTKKLVKIILLVVVVFFLMSSIFPYASDKKQGLILYDKFEYEVGRDDSSSVKRFIDKGGWSGIKTVQNGERGARGHLYTTEKIPGYAGTFPGINSKRVLAMEALPSTLGNRASGFWGDMQTDFWLQFGSGNSSMDTVPANVWFQFWVYPTGNFEHYMKFIYPCNGSYPCKELKWMFLTGSVSAEPRWTFNGDALKEGPASDIFLRLIAYGASYSVKSYYGGGETFGQQDVSELLVSNRWTKVKMHMDTSGTQGRWEAWLQPLGSKEIKVAEWYGGNTPNFTWPIAKSGGHRVFRMPTTIGTPRVVSKVHNFDSIIYMDDFAMAASEQDLPVYP